MPSISGHAYRTNSRFPSVLWGAGLMGVGAMLLLSGMVSGFAFESYALAALYVLAGFALAAVGLVRNSLAK